VAGSTAVGTATRAAGRFCLSGLDPERPEILPRLDIKVIYVIWMIWKTSSEEKR
jgi:hypothetical protein